MNYKIKLNYFNSTAILPRNIISFHFSFAKLLPYVSSIIYPSSHLYFILFHYRIILKTLECHLYRINQLFPLVFHFIIKFPYKLYRKFL